MICFGCSSTGRERINAATSSAVFHLANCESIKYSTQQHWVKAYTLAFHIHIQDYKRSQADWHAYKSVSIQVTHLTETLLTSPDLGVDDLQEQLSSTWVEDEDSTIDRLGGQVAFERLDRK